MLRLIAVLLTAAVLFAVVERSDAADESLVPPPLEFTTDVMPIISKSGCNLGTCHGNLNGKGGLKLSLRGQDPGFDHQAIVRAARGRRVNVASPSLSLVLQKAIGAVPHGGGSRFTEQSEAYRLLSRWMSEGARGPSTDAATLAELKVEPTEAIVTDPQDRLQVHVRATFSDGSTRDVTDTACYELSNLKAEVDSGGVVTRKKFGETTLIVRYLDQQRPIPIAFVRAQKQFVWQDPEAFNQVDRHVFAKLRRLRVNPSALCDDSVFVRRAYLDAIGRIPTADEARNFVADADPRKRSKLIDDLLMRPEFADFWALKWADVLRTEEKVLDTKGVEVFHAWIRERIAKAEPVDQFVRTLVTATGSTFENPPANYYRANRDPSTRGETTARLFLGTRLQCAKCHNHPFDRWTQDDYYRWSSLFSQLDYEIGENKRQDKLDKNEFAGDQVVKVAKADEVRNPATNEIATPKYLGGQSLGEQERERRLEAMSVWLTSRENELFVKSQTNFIWYQLMGLGLVDPIDDFRLTNPPSNPALLDALSQHFIESDFDLRSLVGLIMKSRTYQLSSEPNETNVDDTTSFSHAFVRRLPAEVLLDMQSDFLGMPAKFLGYDEGIRAVQIPGVLSKQARRSSPKGGDRFLKTFGKPDRILACDCERSNETTLKQAFVLIGEGLSDRIASPENRIAKLATSGLSDAEVVEEVYWSALSRAPTDPELAAALELVGQSGATRASSFGDVLRSMIQNPSNNQRVESLQDLAWALLNAKEFLFRR